MKSAHHDRPERAEYIIWAFRAYATGKWSVTRLAAELEARGAIFSGIFLGPEPGQIRAELNEPFASITQPG
ncbi:hypothetical protein MLP_45650 [Microlunatus phosphovorus NM-1]|uniref:Uncharacterized protein n=1 Tax=Microlunatus phosphovorus (strain ATCC 700054 / DSM 10555 / JCM 9379 / NBRC 101784 / NCIMB 13414 / VKM Ac-1990 / NM-1) TaxID=1032480 RepID=F5XE31_MICPN|nr:hypothetical protein [Microlunatus phosphovorus]BAK37579.1 hypothetical protein MLP_45650 [Microlunatus phosphovorus NM-1]